MLCAEEAAIRLGCSTGEIAPYVYMTITAVSNYMIFGEEAYVAPQMTMVEETIKGLIHAQENAG